MFPLLPVTPLVKLPFIVFLWIIARSNYAKGQVIQKQIPKLSRRQMNMVTFHEKAWTQPFEISFQ